MKKFIIALMLLVCSSSLFAQNVDCYGIPQHSMTLQVSDASVPIVFTAVAVGVGVAMGAGLVAVLSGGQAEIDAPQLVDTTPYFSAEYDYHFPNTRWSLGPELGYWHSALESTSSYEHIHVATLTAAGKFFYKPSGICKLYGGLNLGAGVLFTNTIDTPATKAEGEPDSVDSSASSSNEPGIFPAIQFNPIGMRLGSEKVAFVAELGIGYKGIFQLGVNFAL